MPSSDRSPASLSAWIFASVLPLVASLALLPNEFTYYKRWLELGPDEIGLRVIVGAAILSKTLAALAIGLGLLAIFGRSLSPARIRGASLCFSLLVLGTLTLDLELQRATGNAFDRYLPYLFDPDTFLWAGEGFDVWPSLLGLAWTLAIAFAPASALAWLAERWAARAPARRPQLLLTFIAGLVVLLLTLPPLVQRLTGPSAHLYHLSEQMPWSWSPGAGSQVEETDTIERAAQAIFDRARIELASAPDLTGQFDGWEPSDRPDILVIVVESLRHDALDPQTMPNLWAASERGLRFDSHYATSNASHYGLFALLYGRSPLFYFETLESERPTLPAQLREWGYATHHLTCSDIRWRQMDVFLGPRDFAVERFRGGSLDACDRALAARAAALLAPGDRAPRFVLGFMMSTHFGYYYPEGGEVFEPSAAPPNALELDERRDASRLRNRYRNSAHHVDAMIATLLERIDLDRTLVVVTGDHGEALFDDGTVGHASRLSEAQTRVPLVLFGAGLRRGAARSGPTDHADILPTIFARLGIDPDRLRSLPGRDLTTGPASPFVALVHAKPRAGGRDRIALGSVGERYSLRLDTDSGELDFLGRLRPDGRPARGARTDGTDTRVLDWLEHYLDSLSP